MTAWTKPHWLHLTLDHGYLAWTFECLDVADCDMPTVDVDGTPEEPRTCWIEEHLPLFSEGWDATDVLGDLSLDPLRTPVLVNLDLPGVGPESGPHEVHVRLAP